MADYYTPAEENAALRGRLDLIERRLRDRLGVLAELRRDHGHRLVTADRDEETQYLRERLAEFEVECHRLLYFLGEEEP